MTMICPRCAHDHQAVMMPADTLMWEARTAPEARTRLVEWVKDTLVPCLRSAPGYLEADLFLGSPDRVVLIARFESAPPRLPAPPAELLTRPAHQWPFTHHWRERFSFPGSTSVAACEAPPLFGAGP
jgi:hypothetical protein